MAPDGLTPKERVFLQDHLPLIYRIAGSFMRRIPNNGYISNDELINAGRMAVIETARRWWPRRGAHNLDALVRVRVRGAIIDVLRSADRLPRRLRRSSEEIHVFSDSEEFVSKEIEQQIVANSQINPEESAAEQEKRDHRIRLLRQAIEKLPPRERLIIEKSLEGSKFGEISRMLNVTGARISQLHKRARRHLSYELAGKLPIR
jgi:RNA polymerase sigma factor (sigma-70 family)